MTGPDIDRIVEAAWEARRMSYSPYSGFAVGAAVLMASGRVYVGTNIENASYSLTNCAERVAIQAAAAAGEREIVAIAVVADTESFVTPCGACRQVLSEFRQKQSDKNIEIQVVVENGKGERFSISLNDLLPHPFSLDSKP